MSGKRATTTKYEIVQTASERFMEIGCSNTSPDLIANKPGISSGNLTDYCPTKEHLLYVKGLQELIGYVKQKNEHKITDIFSGGP